MSLEKDKTNKIRAADTEPLSWNLNVGSCLKLNKNL